MFPLLSVLMSSHLSPGLKVSMHIVQLCSSFTEHKGSVTFKLTAGPLTDAVMLYNLNFAEQ